MSEKKELRWENPAEIYVPGFLNNRELNPVYIELLEDSMQKEGFLPTFPIVCFRRLDLPYFDDYTSELYICAAGAHRTTAAQNLDLEKVYVDFRTGTMDDFIEAMHTDNFQFDPALDASLGQLFTKTEKREACKQLLLLPKYLKLTNVALADTWHTSEGNIRRWREEIASLINDTPDRLGFCSPERIAEIQEILASPVRETVAGDVVHIRQKSHDGKWDYYWGIKRKVDAIDDLEWEGVISYCQHVYEVEEVDDLPMKQLSELDILITEKDKDFLQRCRKYGEATRKLNAAREACHKVYRECKKEFDDLMLLRESSYDDVYKKCFTSFGRAISRNFGRNLLASAYYTDTVAKFELETQQLKILLKDIQTPAAYIQKFVDRYQKRREQQRVELEKELIGAHHLMLAGVQEKYPGIDLYKFALQVDSKSYWVAIGQTPSVAMQRSDIDEEKTDKDLSHILKHYQDILKDIDEDAEWILKLVQQPVFPEATPAPQDLDAVTEKFCNALEASNITNQDDLDELLKKAAVHYSFDYTHFLYIANLFDIEDCKQAAAYCDGLTVPQIESWKNTLMSMKRDIETGDNWAKGFVADISEINYVTVAWGDGNMEMFRDKGEKRGLSEIPDALLVQLLEIARKGESS